MKWSLKNKVIQSDDDIKEIIKRLNDNPIKLLDASDNSTIEFDNDLRVMIITHYKSMLKVNDNG